MPLLRAQQFPDPPGFVTVTGSAVDRAGTRASASALAVELGAALARSAGREPTSGVVLPYTATPVAAQPLVIDGRIGAGPLLVRQQQGDFAAPATIVTGSATDRGGTRASASGLAVVLGASLARSPARELGTALDLALGASLARGAARASATSVVLPYTVEAVAMQPLVIDGRIGAGPLLVRQQQSDSAPPVVVVTGSAVDRAGTRASATGLTLELGASADRGGARASASALAVELGAALARSAGREPTSGVVLPYTATPVAAQPLVIDGRIGAGPLLVRQQLAETAAPVVVVTGSATDRGAGRASASGLAVVPASAADRGGARASATALNLALGAALARSAGREPGTSVILPYTATPVGVQPALPLRRIGQGPLLLRQQQSDIGAAVPVVTGSAVDRAGTRASATSLRFILAGSLARTPGRERAPAGVVVLGQAVARASSRVTVSALMVVPALSATRTYARTSSTASLVHFGASLARSSGRALVGGNVAASSMELGTGGRGPGELVGAGLGSDGKSAGLGADLAGSGRGTGEIRTAGVTGDLR